MKEKKILFDSPEAAQEITTTGWKSRNGRFYGKDENIARYDGCTHKVCECGELMTKHYTKCEKCRAKASNERYNNLEFKEWDEVTPVCTWGGDEYFFDSDAIDDYLNDNMLTPEDLQLVLCKPNYFHEITSEYWSDILPEESDGELPKEFQKKLDDLNKFIDKLDPISWSGSTIRTKYKS